MWQPASSNQLLPIKLLLALPPFTLDADIRLATPPETRPAATEFIVSCNNILDVRDQFREFSYRAHDAEVNSSAPMRNHVLVESVFEIQHASIDVDMYEGLKFSWNATAVRLRRIGLVSFPVSWITGICLEATAAEDQLSREQIFHCKGGRSLTINRSDKIYFKHYALREATVNVPKK